MDSSFLAFLVISAVVIATPGPDTALTIRNVVAGGRPAGLATALGVSVGQLIWAIATSLGLVAVLLASEPIFHALRLAGAAYLVYLGVQSLRSALSKSAFPSLKQQAPSTLSPRKAFFQGILNDLANPKMAVFFASVLPQFAPQGQGMLSHLILLGLVFSLLTFAWLAIYVSLVAFAGAWLSHSKVRRAVDGVAGFTLVGMGVRVATSER
ncbi:LysE family translocator [Piscinibacter sp. HJYY11]|uniref:LysE family translocator n=1 Tax=Piscinibacter sp. HJYY11 TaxID=2801333 RepID=UPI00191EB6F2|nr:LysE family translocator [Piscinibacter sp. HJYY11]MBL0726068.1 LysE family translocator [Piscinibacter sp. HJYY11]